MNVRILVDADACPVKDEVYKVAWRHEVPVAIVSNSRLRVPDHPLIERVTVSDAFDAADDWIVEAARSDSIVVTADILLADRCLKAGATVLAPTGKPFTTTRSAARSRHGRSWPTCVPAAINSAARRRSAKSIDRHSCKRSTLRSSA